MELAVRGTGERVRVNSIICLGRNYRAHARELGNPVPERPVVFLKPNSSAVPDGADITVPRGSAEVHHEVELAVIIGEPGRDIPEGEAIGHVLGYAVMLDITERGVQDQLKKKGLPWLLAKGQDTFAPISDIAPRDAVPDPHALHIRLEVNGRARQDASTGQMIFRIPYVISYISSFMTLQRGDVIATGTPEGVGPLRSGDRVVAEIEKVGRLAHAVRSTP